jgi:hypothetical protein
MREWAVATFRTLLVAGLVYHDWITGVLVLFIVADIHGRRKED